MSSQYTKSMYSKNMAELFASAGKKNTGTPFGMC